jgi:hypothetical protein
MNDDDTFYTTPADDDLMEQAYREGCFIHLQTDEMSAEELDAAMLEWFYASMRNACRKGKFDPDGAA